MSDTDAELKSTRLNTEALLVGYAMSRLDADYLHILGFPTWRAAFASAAASLSIPPNSVKNLRDEFDPAFTNTRVGRIDRPMRSNRQRMLDEMADVDTAGLVEIVRRILGRDEDAIVEALDALAPAPRIVANVAERLLTGRRAEEYFLTHCAALTGIDPADIVDKRQDASGYDFGVQGHAHLAFEVKGIKTVTGSIQFTDREWTEAERRRRDYALVVVGNLRAEPDAKVFADPFGTVAVSRAVQTTVSVVWRGTVSINA